MKLKELLEKMKDYTLVHIYNEEGTKIAGMLPENARKYLSILLLERDESLCKRERDRRKRTRRPDGRNGQ